jgi:hypothetical protein
MAIMRRELYYPVLDCFMRALPFHYRGVTRPVGTLANFQVAGDGGGTWHLLREDTGWRLVSEPIEREASRTVIPQEIAWRIFTKGFSKESAMEQVELAGDIELASHILSMISIVG